MKDAESLKELFAPFAPVTVRRLFGGAGIYADGLCFAIESRGEVYIKTDAETQGAFAAAGSKAFVYEMQGKPKSMACWRLVADAHDDPKTLKGWAALGLAAARRAAVAKTTKPGPPRRKAR